MTETPKSDLAIHLDSLSRLQDSDGFGLKGAITFGLEWLRDQVTVVDVVFSAPAWRNKRWSVVATVTLARGNESRDVTLTLPWLLDDEAATSGHAAGIKDRVGSFRGTYWEGRFRQPIVGYMWRPGVHRITSPVEGGNTYRGLIVGEYGTMWQLRIGRNEEGIDEVLVRSRYSPLSADDRQAFDVAGLMQGSRSDELDGLQRTITDGRRFTSGAALTDRQVRDLVEWLGTIERIDRGTKDARGRLLRRESLDPHDPMAVPMDERHWRPAGLGAQLAAAIAHAVSEVARRASTAHELDQAVVVSRLRTAMATAVDHVVRGLDDFSASVVGERPINTLARMEASRQRTFIGFGGLEHYQGRLDLRVLPGQWRGILCPLQTQESAKIGMIRHATLSGWDGGDPEGVRAEYADLSAAAALIPFIGHDDPTRSALGCKMLKQAVVLDHPEAPRIRTGVEALVGEVGTTRSPATGARSSTDFARGTTEVGSSHVATAAQASWPPLPGEGWVEHRASEWAENGDVLAHAPDVVLDEGRPILAYGLNATVAYLAWHGLNYEDGIVISESFSQRMSSPHTVRLSTAYDPQLGAEEYAAVDTGTVVAAGTPILKVRGEVDRVLSMPEDGYLIPADDAEGYRYSMRSGPTDFEQQVRIAYRATRPLLVGDKLTTRHGGKGVVTRIEPDAQMPRLPDGRVIEVVLNPLGVIRRLNMGTLIELAAGLELALTDGWDAASSRVVPRRLGRPQRLALARRLEDLGAKGGKLALADAAGDRIGPPDGVMVGPLYIVKLDHLSKQKGGSSDDAAPSPVTFQPVKASAWKEDRRRAAPQRLGEMELWSLEAIEATKTLDDLLAVRGVGQPELREDRNVLPAGLRAALGYLAVAGVSFISNGEWKGHPSARDITLDPATGAPEELVRALWRGGQSGSGLDDVIETFAGRARDALEADMRKSRKGEGKAAPGHWAIASQILELAIGEPALSDAGPDRGTGETVRYEIVLPEPVDHPWNAKNSVTGAHRVLRPLTRLAVLPASAFGGISTRDRDPLRRRYREIIRWVLIHNEATDLRSRQSAVKHIDREVRSFLGSIREVGGDADTIAGRTTGKFGLLRRNGLGATAIRSGRAVLVGDPALDPEHVRIPKWMASDLGIDSQQTASGYSDVVIVNRQPTLHPYGLQALRAETWNENAVALHPVLLQSIAGDFDGDTVAVHRLESEDARREIWDLRRPAAALRSGASGKLLAKLDQDVQLGLALSRGAASSDSEGLAEALIEPLPVSTNAQRAAALALIVGLQQEGLEAARRWGPSMVSLDPPDAEAGLAAYLQESAADLYLGFASGAAGSLGSDALRQWLLARGTAVSPVLELPDVDIHGNYLDGIADEDYFAAAQPAITGIAAKKLLTPFAGTLTRNLVRHGYEIVISRPDCYEDRREHSIFDCTDLAGPCAKAYGANPETGLPMRVGEPVGIRAALFIGEKGTQTALKSIHDRSGEGSGKSKLRELSAILLRNGRDSGDGFGGGGGTLSMPGSDEFAAFRGSKATPLAHPDFAKRVMKRGFPKLDEPTHDVFVMMQEILVARFREILPEVNSKHAAVLIRQRFLFEDPVTARPDDSPDGELLNSALLPTSVWTGRLRMLVLALGVHAEWDDRKQRLVATTTADTELIESSEHIAATERLTTTLRNAREEVRHG